MSEYAWLIERGQPEGQTPTVWVTDDERSGRYGGWTTDANKARRFQTREEAEAFIKDKTPGNMRAVEHGWFSTGVSANPNTEREEFADVLARIERVYAKLLAARAGSDFHEPPVSEWAVDASFAEWFLLARALRLVSEQIAEYRQLGLEDQSLEATPESVQAGLLREAGKT